MSQKCNTLLCGKDAVYKHSRTGEFKCEHCRDKRGDKHSLAWTLIQEEKVEEDSDGFLKLPPAKVNLPYSISETNRGSLVLREDEDIVYFSKSIEEAKKVCGELNKAFKFGAESVLHKLNTFSLDQRRNFGIVWGNKEGEYNH